MIYYQSISHGQKDAIDERFIRVIFLAVMTGFWFPLSLLLSIRYGGQTTAICMVVCTVLGVYLFLETFKFVIMTRDAKALAKRLNVRVSGVLLMHSHLGMRVICVNPDSESVVFRGTIHSFNAKYVFVWGDGHSYSTPCKPEHLIFQ